MAILATLKRFSTYASNDLGGGHRPVRLAHVINAQKGGTFVALGLLMLWYGNATPAAFTYLALHGSYGLCWLLKDIAFPDGGWQRRVTLGGAAVAFFAVLFPYWVIGWLLISGTSSPSALAPSAAWLAFCITLHTLGVAVMLSADAQKHFTLAAKPGLITTGMFARIRHPNYLGEMMVYGTYALLAWHWLGFAILGVIWAMVFAPNIAAKEASLARYPGWAAYKARTGLLLPKLGAGGGT